MRFIVSTRWSNAALWSLAGSSALAASASGPPSSSAPSTQAVILDVPRNAPSHPVSLLLDRRAGGIIRRPHRHLQCSLYVPISSCGGEPRLCPASLVKLAVPPLLTRCFVRCYPAVRSLFRRCFW